MTCPKHFEHKNDKELIGIYPLKGHKGREDAVSAWRVKQKTHAEGLLLFLAGIIAGSKLQTAQLVWS